MNSKDDKDDDDDDEDDDNNEYDSQDNDGNGDRVMTTTIATMITNGHTQRQISKHRK